jgi:hypothetical protein
MPTDGSSHGSTCYDCRSGNDWPPQIWHCSHGARDVPMERLGRCDYHEHLFQASPLLVGDELDDEQASRQEAESLRRAGIDAFIDATLRVSGAILAPSPVSVSRRALP